MQYGNTLLERILFGIRHWQTNNEQPSVANYTHITCIIGEIIVLWKFFPDIAPMFTFLFACHLLLLFGVSYVMQRAVEQYLWEETVYNEQEFDQVKELEQKEAYYVRFIQKLRHDESINQIRVSFVRLYQSVELIICIAGVFLHFKFMCIHLLLSYCLTLLLTSLINTFWAAECDSFLGNLVCTICFYISKWLPFFALMFVLACCGLGFVTSSLVTIVYMLAMPLVISFEYDFGGLYEIAFNHRKF